MERLLFAQACKLNVSGALSKSEALAIESVVDIYRDIMDAFRGLKAANSLLQTELRSLETLAVFISRRQQEAAKVTTRAEGLARDLGKGTQPLAGLDSGTRRSLSGL